MKNIISLILALIAFANSYAQLEIYKTIDDYKKGTPVKYTMTDIKYYADVVGSHIYHPMLQFKENGKKVKIDMTENWGFKYKDILFVRDATRGNLIVGLLSSGKINYWENAVFIFKKIEHQTPGMSEVDYGDAAYLSTEIGSTLISFNTYRKFFQNNKGYDNLLQCVHDNSTLNDKKLKLANKVFNLGGEDSIALFMYFSRANNEKDLSVLRKCIKDMNGNFNSQIPIVISKD